MRGPTSEHYNLYLMKSLSCLSLTNLSAEIDFFFNPHGFRHGGNSLYIYCYLGYSFLLRRMSLCFPPTQASFNRHLSSVGVENCLPSPSLGVSLWACGSSHATQFSTFGLQQNPFSWQEIFQVTLKWANVSSLRLRLESNQKELWGRTRVTDLLSMLTFWIFLKGRMEMRAPLR